VNEKMIKRITFAKNGEMIKLEDRVKEKTKLYWEFKPEYKKSNNLKKYLTKTAWFGEFKLGDKKARSITIYEPDSVHTYLNIGDITREISSGIEYKNNLKIIITSNGKVKKTDKVYPLSPKSFTNNLSSSSGVKVRVELGSKEKEELESKIKKLD